MTVSTKNQDWWLPFYEETPFELNLLRSDEIELRATLNFLWDKLHLSPGKRALDQCCGLGALSIPLAARGANLVGVDLCEKYIRMALTEAERLNLPCRFHCADAFTFVPDRPCDAAFNWWTSFGYATDDNRNLLMLQRAFEALKPGGWFALDYPNIAGVLHNFSGCATKRHTTAEGEILIIRETSIVLEQGLRNELWTFVMPDGRRLVHDTNLRIYLPHVLVGMLRQCGFSDIELFGSTLGEQLRIDSARCICLARRPE